MQTTLFDKFLAQSENKLLLQQEVTILEVTETICALMDEQKVSRTELAARLGKSKAFVTQLLQGRANMTLRTISDVLHALGHGLKVEVGPLAWESVDSSSDFKPILFTQYRPIGNSSAITNSGHDWVVPYRGLTA